MFIKSDNVAKSDKMESKLIARSEQSLEKSVNLTVHLVYQSINADLYTQ